MDGNSLVGIGFYFVAIAINFIVPSWHYHIFAQPLSPQKSLSVDNPLEIYRLCESATVRIIKPNSAGSGVIIDRRDNVYSVLTNWHVVDSSNPTVLTVDGERHNLVEAPRQIADADLALLQFYSEADYFVAKIEPQLPQVGDTVYVAGFPLMIDESNSLGWGNRAFRIAKGEISIVPVKSLPQGYQLGYTNNTQIGMSGSPIFNSEGFLIAIHGRGKYREPGFGAYIFADGSEPTPPQLEQMIESSWGIPLGVYDELLQ